MDPRVKISPSLSLVLPCFAYKTFLGGSFSIQRSSLQLLPHEATEELVYLPMPSLFMSKGPLLHESFGANVN